MITARLIPDVLVSFFFFNRGVNLFGFPFLCMVCLFVLGRYLPMLVGPKTKTAGYYCVSFVTVCALLNGGQRFVLFSTSAGW